MHWGWCPFIEVNILCTEDASKLLFRSLWNVHFALVIQISSVLIVPNIANKDFSCQIRSFLYREPCWNAFQAKESLCCTPALRKEGAGHWFLCRNDRRIRCGNEVWWHSWARSHGGWSLYIEVNVKALTLLALCFVEFLQWQFCLFIRRSPVQFSPMCQDGMVMHNLQSSERTTSLKGLSGNEKFLQHIRAPRSRGTILFCVHILYEKYSCAKARVCFLSNIKMGIWYVHRCDDSVEPGRFQTVVCGVCVMLHLPWLYQLALCCFSLICKRRNSPAKTGFSSEEIKFGVPFMAWKHHAWNQWSDSKKQPIVLSPTMCRRILVGGEGKGCFREHRCIWAHVFSLSWIHVSNKSLHISCWWSLSKGSFAQLYKLGRYFCPEMEKKDFSCQIRLLFWGEEVWKCFQALWTSCTNILLREVGAAPVSLSHYY